MIINRGLFTLQYIRQQRHARVPYHHINLRQVSRIRHFKFAQLLRQYRSIHIHTTIIFLVRLSIASPGLRRGLDWLAVFVKFFEIVFFGNAAVELREVTLLFVQFPGYAGNLPGCCFRLCIFLCALIRCFHQMHILAVFRQHFIRPFHLNLQGIRKDDIAFFCTQRKLLHCNGLIQLQKCFYLCPCCCAVWCSVCTYLCFVCTCICPCFCFACICICSRFCFACICP